MARIKILTVEEAKRGIYIDFEGFGSKPESDEIPEPHMLGVWSTTSTDNIVSVSSRFTAKMLHLHLVI